MATRANFEKKSTKHMAKFQKLLHPETKLEKLGAVSVSFQDEFLIGKGSQGTRVFIGLHDDGSEVAVKRIVSDITNNSEQTDEKEISGLLNLEKSDHIVHYRDFISDDPFSFIILDLCEETLADYVQHKSKEFLGQRGPVIIRDILMGLRALHNKKILHRNLKPLNILVDKEGGMRLADFGVSRVLHEGETTLYTSSQRIPTWMAAESILTGNDTQVKFKQKSDVQVAGMISFFVLTKGQHPFGKSTYDTTTNILNGTPVNLDMLSDPIAKSFISWLISHEIKDRPHAQEALQHYFLQSYTSK